MKAKILFFAMCFATVAMAQTSENDTTVVLDTESVTSNSNWVIDGDNVYLESTSAKVGIRTDSQQEALHVNGFIRGEGPGGALRINTDYGITTIGAVSGNYSHFGTTKPRFYFYKPIMIEEVKSQVLTTQICTSKPSIIMVVV